MIEPLRLACLGFGELARSFTASWRGATPLAVTAYDLKLEPPEEWTAMRAAMAAAGATAAPTPADAVANAEVVLSAVTADQCLTAARSVAGALTQDAFYLDVNSVAPETKRQAAALLGPTVRYVDVAVMAPVKTKGHRTPLLVGSTAADAAADLLTRLDLRYRMVADGIGPASAIKMMRSIVVKGIEALLGDCLLASRRAGVSEAVLDSLAASHPGFDWRGHAAHALDRMVVHGARRAAEMREVARMLADLGLDPAMATATAARQQAFAALGLAEAWRGTAPADHAGMADAALQRMIDNPASPAGPTAPVAG